MKDLYNLHDFYSNGKSSKQLNNRRKSFGYQILGFGSGVASVVLAGNDKGIFAYGRAGSPRVSMSNLVSNVGVVATDTTGVGTARESSAATQYGDDKGIFGYGTTGSVVSVTNLVSNSGVIGSDVSGVGTARTGLASCSYDSLDKGIFAYGNNASDTAGADATDGTGGGGGSGGDGGRGEVRITTW